MQQQLSEVECENNKIKCSSEKKIERLNQILKYYFVFCQLINEQLKRNV